VIFFTDRIEQVFRSTFSTIISMDVEVTTRSACRRRHADRPTKRLHPYKPRLVACGQAFVAHGIPNPALYRLLSAALTSREAGRPAIEKVAAARARAVVDSTLADAVRSGALPSSMANPREGAAASLAICCCCMASLCWRSTISSARQQMMRLW